MGWESQINRTPGSKVAKKVSFENDEYFYSYNTSSSSIQRILKVNCVNQFRLDYAHRGFEELITLGGHQKIDWLKQSKASYIANRLTNQQPYSKGLRILAWYYDSPFFSRNVNFYENSGIILVCKK